MLEAVASRDIALSGLKAQRARMNVIANNIANALTPSSSKGGAFRRQLAILEGQQIKPGGIAENWGVRVKNVVDDMSPLRQVFDPSHPNADKNGYVSYPNVDLSVETVDLVSAQRAYEANVAVMVSDKRMSQKALDILQV